MIYIKRKNKKKQQEVIKLRLCADFLKKIDVTYFQRTTICNIEPHKHVNHLHQKTATPTH